MKVLKPGVVSNPRPKRKPVQRPTQAAGNPAPPIHPGNTGSASGSVGVKRKRGPYKKKNAGPSSTQIQCFSCKQTDVPLILGGRKCSPPSRSNPCISDAMPQDFVDLVWMPGKGYLRYRKDICSHPTYQHLQPPHPRKLCNLPSHNLLSQFLQLYHKHQYKHQHWPLSLDGPLHPFQT